MEKMEGYRRSLDFIDNWLNYQMYSNEIHGAAVGVFVEDELIFNKTYGYADFENKIKLTNDHLFRIASQSKLFTATAIMKLVEDNKLSIDDKVSKYLAWFESAEDDNLQDITIKHLLTHSSGIQSDTRTGFWSNYTPPVLVDIQQLLKKGISKFKAGEILKYSNLGFALLGQVIESVSGKKFEKYVQDSILIPLEMDDTAMDINESNIQKHVTGYDTKYPRQDRERIEHFSSGIINPAGGMSSNVTNLAKFFQAHMYGDQSLLPDDLKKEMQSTQFEHNNERRGLGFWLGQVPNGPSIAYHMGGYPGFRSCSAVYQEDKMAIIVLTNAYDGPATNWLMAIKSILDVYVVHWDEFTIDNLEQKPDFSELIGYYRTSGAISHFTQIGDRLVSILPGSSNPLQSLIIYDYLGDLTFLSPTESAFAKIGEEIHFVQGESGEKILLESDNSKAPKFNLDEY